MTAQNIINWLSAKSGQVNTPADVAQFKVDLRAQLSTLSLDVTNQKANAITLLYSGEMGKNGVKFWQVAEDISQKSDGAVRTIGQSELGKLLNSEDFKREMRAVANNDTAVISEIMDGKTQNNIRTEAGIWDWSSDRFVKAAPGETRFMGSFASNGAVFTQTEIKAFLQSNSTSLEGIPRQTLVDFYVEQVAKVGEAEALLKVRDQVAVVALESSSRLEIGRNSVGDLLVGSDKYFDATRGYAGTALSPDASSKLTGLQVMSGLLADSKEGFKNTIDYAKSSDVLSAFERGTLTATEAAARGLNKLGVAGIALTLYFANVEANAAELRGDKYESNRIMGAWAAENASAFAVGAAASTSTAAYFLVA
jgi:hypothetical protein